MVLDNSQYIKYVLKKSSEISGFKIVDSKENAICNPFFAKFKDTYSKTLLSINYFFKSLGNKNRLSLKETIIKRIFNKSEIFRDNINNILTGYYHEKYEKNQLVTENEHIAGTMQIDFSNLSSEKHKTDGSFYNKSGNGANQ